MKGMETIVKRRLEPSQKDTKEDDMDTIFRKMIASEVRLFSEDVKFEVKHEINNIIYRYKVQERVKRQRIQSAITSPPPSVDSHSLYSPLPTSPVYSPRNTGVPAPFDGYLQQHSRFPDQYQANTLFLRSGTDLSQSAQE